MSDDLHWGTSSRPEFGLREDTRVTGRRIPRVQLIRSRVKFLARIGELAYDSGAMRPDIEDIEIMRLLK